MSRENCARGRTGNSQRRATKTALAALLICTLFGCRPDSPQQHVRNGLDAAKRGQDDIAIAEYNKAIELNPKLTIAYVNRGVAFWRKSDFSRAIKDDNLALALDPRDAHALGNLAASQYHLDKYDDALRNTQAALEIDPSLAYARFNEGLIYATKGDWGKAQLEYRTGLFNCEPEELDGAIEQLRLAIKLHPESGALRKSLALLQKETSGDSKK